MNADHIANLQQYLAVHVDIRHRHDMLVPEWHYVGMEDFVLKEGEIFWEISPWQPEVDGAANRYRPRIPKQCFDNSYKAAVASKGKLSYVEGFAYNGLIPVHHAWNADEKGRVVDTTWCGNGGEYCFWPTVGTAYIGVKFPTTYVRTLRTGDNTCVIDQWQKDWPVLRVPYNYDALEVVA